MGRRKTNGEFVKEVKGLVGDEYIFLEEYKNNSTKLRVRHNDCGYEYKTTPNNFLSTGRRCPRCSGYLGKTHDQFVKEVYELVQDEYSIMERYKGVDNKIKVVHNICEYEYRVSPSSFTNNGARCPKCAGNMKMTNEEFTSEVDGLVGEEYTFLTPYINSVTKLKVVHNLCGYEYEVTPTNFINHNSRCPDCKRKRLSFLKTKTQEEFDQEVSRLRGNEYTFLEPYIDSQIKIKVRHNVCGYEYKVEPNSFLSGSGCANCAGNRPITDKEFNERVRSIVGDEYTFLEEYKNSTTRVKVRHNECRREYLVSPDSFYAGARCHCNRYKTDEEFKNEVEELVGGEYKFTERYKGYTNPIKVRHNKCGYTYKITPQNFIRGRKCPDCAGSRPKTTQEFSEEVSQLVGSEYEFLEEYINAMTKIKVRHNECGHVYEVAPNTFLGGNRCPNCYESKGEKSVKDVLSTLEVKFEREARFDDCRHIYTLPFDFGIYDSVDELIGLIEYDGIQHYKPSFGQESFEHTQLTDSIKNEYCKDNSIPLLRIPYWDFDNVDKIVEEFLIEVGALTTAQGGDK